MQLLIPALVLVAVALRNILGKGVWDCCEASGSMSSRGNSNERVSGSNFITAFGPSFTVKAIGLRIPTNSAPKGTGLDPISTILSRTAAWGTSARSYVSHQYDRMLWKSSASAVDVGISPRKFAINGWRWHTESLLRDIDRFCAVVKKLQAGQAIGPRTGAMQLFAEGFNNRPVGMNRTVKLVRSLINKILQIFVPPAFGSGSSVSSLCVEEGSDSDLSRIKNFSDGQEIDKLQTRRRRELHQTEELKTLLSCYEFVFNFNWSALKKVESQLILPWLRTRFSENNCDGISKAYGYSSIHSDVDHYTNQILSQHNRMGCLQKEIGEICQSIHAMIEGFTVDQTTVKPTASDSNYCNTKLVIQKQLARLEDLLKDVKSSAQEAQRIKVKPISLICIHISCRSSILKPSMLLGNVLHSVGSVLCWNN